MNKLKFMFKSEFYRDGQKVVRLVYRCDNPQEYCHKITGNPKQFRKIGNTHLGYKMEIREGIYGKHGFYAQGNIAFERITAPLHSDLDRHRHFQRMTREQEEFAKEYERKHRVYHNFDSGIDTGKKDIYGNSIFE